MSISITVEGYGGAGLDEICADMVSLANRIGIDVWCDCNGVRVLACPKDDVDALRRSLAYWNTQDRPYRYASAHDGAYRLPVSKPEAS